MNRINRVKMHNTMNILNVIDTTTHSIKDTVSAVKEKIVSGTALLF